MKQVEITGFELISVNFPFRQAFRHAAGERTASETIILKCLTSAGSTGFGETLPRLYVTGESPSDTFNFLKDEILPRLVGTRFSALNDIVGYLEECDGEPPVPWVSDRKVRTAAWCAVDLALLDSFGKAFKKQIILNND